MTRPDVTVFGAGIFGLSIAWACLKHGASVQVIDPAGPGAGASGGVVGALAPHVPENWNDKKAFQLESLLMARAFWAEIEDVSGIASGYARSGRLQPVQDDRSLHLARERCAGADVLWQGQAIWEVIETPAAGWYPDSPTGFYIHDTLTARLHPRHACRSLAEALDRKGAMLGAEGTPAGKVVHATGVTGLEQLSQALGRTV